MPAKVETHQETWEQLIILAPSITKRSSHNN